MFTQFAESLDENVRLINALIPKISFNDDWAFDIFGHPQGYSFRITIKAVDSTGRGMYVRDESHLYDYKLDPRIIIVHNFPINPFPMNKEEIEDWVFDKIVLVTKHEAMEAFKVDGKAIFFPDHSLDGDPYTIKRNDR